MITVIIAEDHQALIDGIKLSIEYENDIQVIGEANDGEMLVELVRKKQPNVVITDIRMPKSDGISATKIIKKEFPLIKVIAFSMFDQAEAVDQMKKAGASGYIMKNSSLKKVLEAIRIVAQNGVFYDDAITSIDSHTKEEIVLSTREKEILRLIGEGKSSLEISEMLFIGKTTVDTHRKNILRKLNIHGKTDLIRFAVERKYDF
ncbi:two-component system nitrate/nitrite response regulator NarL [Flavobacterium arsenatis]|uniref:Two-component system nitrate/nitrite response regulator NarL n=1 Tax=Flavobacterium arsenatis TaxID=1484332 RepID=A0ABU1TR60_9FLAO|nr:response regulator transcription factor [Flavobacterium arsenatis]MDR6967988.1 two-component system nitrate/nitrite response regulator NarL [Flavobacterium arsenatis]